MKKLFKAPQPFKETTLKALLNKARTDKQFVYTPGIGFTNGFVILFDHPQITAAVTDLTMVDVPICLYWGKTLDLERVVEDHRRTVKDKRHLLEVKELPIFMKLNKGRTIARVFGSGSQVFMFNEKFLTPFNEKFGFEYFIERASGGSHLVIFDKSGAHIAYVLGIRTEEDNDITEAIYALDAQVKDKP